MKNYFNIGSNGENQQQDINEYQNEDYHVSDNLTSIYSSKARNTYLLAFFSLLIHSLRIHLLLELPRS